MKGRIMTEEHVEQEQTSAATTDPQSVKHDGMTLTLGILAIVSALVVPLAGIVFGIIGLVFAAKDKKAFGASACKPGFVCSIVGLSLSGFVLVANVLCVLMSYPTMLI